MNNTLRQALRRTRELRNQVENLLLGDDGDLYEVELKKWVAKRPCWVPVTENVVVQSNTNNPDLDRWLGNYQKYFGKTPDLAHLVIPPKPVGLGPMRLIIVAQEIAEWTNNRPIQGTMDAMKKYFMCHQYTNNLDIDITQNDRDLRNGTYAFWVKDVREADEENVYKSANDLKVENHQGETILERLLHEVDYFEEMGEHMDKNNWTMCSGSRDRDGLVVDAGWDDDGFYVHLFGPSGRFPNFRSRSVYL